MSLDNRNTSAQFKRAEQLKRWEESEMNKKASGIPKSPSSRRIKFSSGCIFLAACVAGDKDEVEWLLKNGADIDTANVDGLTALHQACIDDNLDMVEFLIQKGADVNRKDNEGWTPLHATASCGFLSIARYLIENGADLAAINSDGELAVDLANSDAMEDMIQHHNEEQGIDCEEARQAEERIMLSDATRWLRTDSNDCDKVHPKTGATAIHVAAAKGYNHVLKLLLEGRGDVDRQDVDGWTPLHAAAYWGQKEATQMLLDHSADVDIQNFSGQLAIDIAQDDIVPLLKDARKNAKRTKRRPPSHGHRITDNFENITETPTKVIRVEVKPIDSNKEKEEVSEKENQPTEPDVILRRTQSFENDEKFYQKYAELRARIQANACTHAILPPSTVINNTKTSPGSNNNNNNSPTATTTPASNNTSYLVQRSASLKDYRTLRKTTSNLVLGSTTVVPAPTIASPPTPSVAATPTVPSTASNTSSIASPPTSPTGTLTTTPTSGQIRRSFVPPTRDEESETQRKAHAKRVRETRRSTQGVTLDEIKSAEQLVKKKNNVVGTEFKLEDVSTMTVVQQPTLQSAVSDSPAHEPSFTNKAGAEHGTVTTRLTSASSGLSQRGQQQHNGDSSGNARTRPSSAAGSKTSLSGTVSSGEHYNRVASTTESVGATDTSLLHLRRPPRSAAGTSSTGVNAEENKENDKENDSRTAQATQAVIQRRRRQKRRSTGVVPVGMEDLDPDRQDSPVDGDEKETGSERGRSRVGSTASEADTASGSKPQQNSSRENGGDFIDYKALYEQEKAEKDKLKMSLRKKDEEVVTLKAALDRFTTATTKNNSLSELEKRERRAMERKMSEMEEELKLLQKYKTENDRLRAENRALTRVVSKLTTSAQNQMQSK
ncbi:protein phosphatase 1 regulatory subunit 12B isoform X2 [Anopheles bellator]|uniref:protein phosphatase 1 regulatory subunit 12B isoform X2 n=1 Tax=Anopheles bellator TaxID=139047 RepID=UPI0026498FA7|nr:protein phosphatase 1 regulatory subunit 12B isoform X2 [Anopheles bellator]